MLLSGVDTHLNGLGNMTETGSRPTSAACLATRAPEPARRDAAAAAAAGRGLPHLHGRQVAPGQAARPDPGARGFERDFALLDGGGSYWDMNNVTATSPKLVFTEGRRYLTRLPRLLRDRPHDKMIGFIDANKADGKPFFAYVAHQAPHDPTTAEGLAQPPRRRVRRRLGRDAAGAAEAADRDGITPPGTELAERMWFVPDPTLRGARAP